MDTVTDVTPNAATHVTAASASGSAELPHLPPIAERALKVVDLYKAVIGPRHQAYYLNQFARQEAQPGLRLGWHWPALLSALNWFVFRKMWGTAGRYVALLVVLGVAVWQAAVQLELGRFEIAGVVGAVVVLVSVGAALLANALYYRHCMSLIHQVLVDGCDRDMAGEVLEAQACSNRRWSGQVLVNVAFLLLLPALATFAPRSWDDATVPVPEPVASSVPAVTVASVAPSSTDQPASVALPDPAAGRIEVASAGVIEGEPTAPSPTAASPASAPLAPSSAPIAPADAAQSVVADPERANLSPMLPLSEARASAEAGLVLAGEPRPEPPKAPDVPATGEPRGPGAVPKVPLKQAKPNVAVPDVAKVLPNPKSMKSEPASATVAATAPAAPKLSSKPSDAASSVVAARGLDKPAPPKATLAPGNTAYFVQVGIFAQAANVASVKEQLQAMGVAVVAEGIKMGGEPRTRVRAGPFETEAQAQQTAKKITGVGLPAVLVRLPAMAATSPPAQAPSDSAGTAASGSVP